MKAGVSQQSSPPSQGGSALLREAGDALRLGNTAAAEQLFRRRLGEAPGDVQALTGLADIVVTQGKLGETTALLHRALAAAPDAHGLRVHLARLHQQQAHFPVAMALLEPVPPPLRDTFDVGVLEAALLGALGRRDEEIILYERLTREQPRHAGLWMSLGNALNYAGRKDDAVKALRRSIKLSPAFGEPWWSLANLKSFRFADDDIATMQGALRGDLDGTDALHFHFALGRAFEEREDYRQSFDHYSAGNRLRAAHIPPAQMRVSGLVDAAVETFTPDLFARNRDAGSDARDPIFVIGLQRSGSTLIEQILASHPQIEGTAELMTMQLLWDALTEAGAAEGCNVFQQIGAVDPAVFRQIGEQYLERTRAFRSLDRPMFIDKLPANWLNVGLIRLALPNARIIDARRAPMACGFSNFKQHYATGVTFAYSMASIGHFYRDYLRMMDHFDVVQPGSIHHILNERLIDDPEGEVRRLLDYVGVPFDPACLDFHRNRRAVHTPSAEQVRRPINRDGVDYWRHYEPWLGPLKDALGDALTRWDKSAAS